MASSSKSTSTLSSLTAAIIFSGLSILSVNVFAHPQANAPKASESTELKLNVEQLKKYEGQYQLAPGFVITISEKDAKLMAQATGQPSFEIFAMGEHRFFAKVADIKLQFKLNAEGQAEEMTLLQNGQQMPAPRVK